MNGSVPVSEPAPAVISSEVHASVRNAVKLGGSLALTWGVALAIRLFLPRYLGPERFGTYSFAEAFAAGFFVLLGAGVDTYIRKEVPLRPRHASEFMGGIFALRVVASVAVVGAMFWVLGHTHRPGDVKQLVAVLAAVQLLLGANSSLAALLHAVGRVDGLSIVNVVSKVLWGLAIGATVLAGKGLTFVALSLLGSELVKLAALAWLARKHLSLKLRVDVAAAGAVLIASAPFFLNEIAYQLMEKANVSILAFAISEREVGFYSAAANLAGLALLATPLIGWVLLPLMSRAASRSDEALVSLVRRSIEVVLAVAIPAALALGVGADLWVSLLFGEAFQPATASLQMLAPTFVLTYVAMICANLLVRLERAWTVTFVSLVGLCINPALCFVFTRWARDNPGVGRGATAAALAMVVTELIVTTAFLLSVGRKAFDARSLVRLAKALAACAVVVAVDQWSPIRGFARVLIGAGIYVTLALATGAVRLSEITEVMRASRARREEPT